MSSESASEPITDKERISFLLCIIAILTVSLIWVSIQYLNTGDDYRPAFRDGYCAAQHAEFVEPNLCMNGDKVVSVWTE